MLPHIFNADFNGTGCYMSGWQRDNKDEAVHQPLDSFVNKMLAGV